MWSAISSCPCSLSSAMFLPHRANRKGSSYMPHFLAISVQKNRLHGCERAPCCPAEWDYQPNNGILELGTNGTSREFLCIRKTKVVVVLKLFLYANNSDWLSTCVLNMQGYLKLSSTAIKRADRAVLFTCLLDKKTLVNFTSLLFNSCQVKWAKMWCKIIPLSNYFPRGLDPIKRFVEG